ncbi:MAG: hypothetical protein HYY93_12240 [Planctomycetes bacterium]|nr:hypothetical protein [Planctomycetota bacterium]
MKRNRLLVLALLLATAAGCCPLAGRRLRVTVPEGPTCAAHGGPEVRISAAPAKKTSEAPAADDPARRALWNRTFEAVWQTIRDGHYGPESLGVDWNAVREKYRPRVTAAGSAGELYQLLNLMLGELGQSHCAAMPPAPVAEAAAKPAAAGTSAAATAPGESAAAESGEIGDPGIEVRAVEGVACIVSVAPDSPAARAGVKPGFILRGVNGQPVTAPPASNREHELVEWSFGAQRGIFGPLGDGVLLTVSDGPEATPREVKVGRSLMASASLGHLGPIPARFESRRLAGEIGYIRLGSFFTPVFEKYQKAMKEHRDAKALVLDLRGNPGGLGLIAGGVCGYLIRERIELGTSRMKTGEIRFPVFPRPKPFTGKVAILIDEMSASTSEIVAGGLQEAGRARVFGHRTSGAVLPSVVVKLPDGGLLQYPTADFVTPKGVRLEGKGVAPDEEVWWTIKDCAAGRDPILDAAMKWIRDH